MDETGEILCAFVDVNKSYEKIKTNKMLILAHISTSFSFPCLSESITPKASVNQRYHKQTLEFLRKISHKAANHTVSGKY